MTRMETGTEHACGRWTACLTMLGLVITLVGCGGGDGSTAPAAAPGNLIVGYDVKAYQFRWDPVDGAVGYEVQEDARGDGSGLSVGHVATASYRHSLAAQLLSERLNARYRVRACNQGGCGGWSDWLKPDVTRAIGYFKGSDPQAVSYLGHVVALSGDGRTLAVGAPGNPTDQMFHKTYCGELWLRRGEPLDPKYQGQQCGSDPVDEDNEEGQWTVYEVWMTDSRREQNRGVVYVFSRDDQGSWQQQARLVPREDRGGFMFGDSIALADDGHTLAVGAPNEVLTADEIGRGGAPADFEFGAKGAVYVFTRSGNAWGLSARLTALERWTPASVIDPRIGYQKFGTSVALSGDGSLLAVGDPSESSDMRGVIGYGIPSAGGQTVDSRIFCNNTFPGSDSGGVHFFGLTGGQWVKRALIKAPNAELCDAFGQTVAFSRDGKVLAVGALGESGRVGGDGSDNLGPKSGAVYVYQIDERLVHGFPVFKQYLKGSLVPANPDDYSEAYLGFGSSLSLSGDGQTLAIAPGGQAVYVFKQTAPWHWVEQSILRPAVAGMNHSFGVMWFKQSGRGLALTTDGNALVVASSLEAGVVPGINGDQTQYCRVVQDYENPELVPIESSCDSSKEEYPFTVGAAYRFEQRGGTWSQSDYFKASNLPKPPDPRQQIYQIFGSSIAVSGDGSTMAVGAIGEGSLDKDAGIRADQTSYDPAGNYAGAVYLY